MYGARGARTWKVSRKYSIIIASLSYSAKMKRDGQTDERTDILTDDGRFNISHPGLRRVLTFIH